MGDGVLAASDAVDAAGLSHMRSLGLTAVRIRPWD
jgi:hypothetical protein